MKRSFASLQGKSSMSSATASIARHVYGEMPTPISGQGTQGIAPNYCSGHPKPIKNSCLRNVSTTPSWQNLDGMPQAYGFHNLNRQSVYLADGTKHNYFTLPPDYPLDQSTPPVSNSTAENVQTAIQDASSVFKEIAVYDVYEEDVTACRSRLRPAVHTIEIDTEEVEVKVDSDKPIINIERPTDGIFSFADEKESDTELLVVCFKNTSNSAFSEEATDLAFPYGPIIDVDSSSNLSNEKSTQAAPILCDQEATVHCHDEKSEINIMKQDDERACSFLVLKASNTCATKSSSLLSIEHSMRELRLLWDPGATPFSVLFRALVGARILQSTDVYNIVRRAPIFESALTRSYAFGLGWTEVNASGLFILGVPYSKSTSAAKNSRFLSNGVNNGTSHSILKLFLQSQCATTPLQITKQECLLMDKVLQNVSEFRDRQLAYMHQRLIINSSKFLRHMVSVLSRWLSSFENRGKLHWDPGIGTSSSISHWLQNLTAATENTPSSLQTLEPATWLSQVSSASYAWDPGTMLLLCKSICLFLLREEKEKVTLVHEQWIFGFGAMQYCQIIEKCRSRSPLMYWHHDIKFSGIAVWLITFNPP
jgi:hypothetical protein